MCLRTKDPTIKVAQEDIKVYKWLTWPRNEFFKRLMFSPLRGYSAVVARYPYIRNVKQPLVEINPIPLLSYDQHVVNEGYHSYITKDNANAVFIIPKGTKYIEG